MNIKFIACSHTILNYLASDVAAGTLVPAPYKKPQTNRTVCCCQVGDGAPSTPPACTTSNVMNCLRLCKSGCLNHFKFPFAWLSCRESLLQQGKIELKASFTSEKMIISLLKIDPIFNFHLSTKQEPASD